MGSRVLAAPAVAATMGPWSSNRRHRCAWQHMHGPSSPWAEAFRVVMLTMRKCRLSPGSWPMMHCCQVTIVPPRLDCSAAVCDAATPYAPHPTQQLLQVACVRPDPRFVGSALPLVHANTQAGTLAHKYICARMHACTLAHACMHRHTHTQLTHTCTHTHITLTCSLPANALGLRCAAERWGLP